MTEVLGVFIPLKSLPRLKPTVKVIKGTVGNGKMLPLRLVLFFSEIIVSFVRTCSKIT